MSGDASPEVCGRTAGRPPPHRRMCLPLDRLSSPARPHPSACARAHPKRLPARATRALASCCACARALCKSTKVRPRAGPRSPCPVSCTRQIAVASRFVQPRGVAAPWGGARAARAFGSLCRRRHSTVVRPHGSSRAALGRPVLASDGASTRVKSQTCRRTHLQLSARSRHRQIYLRFCLLCVLSIRLGVVLSCLSCLVLSCLAWPCLVFVLSRLVLHCLALPYLVLSCLVFIWLVCLCCSYCYTLSCLSHLACFVMGCLVLARLVTHGIVSPCLFLTILVLPLLVCSWLASYCHVLFWLAWSGLVWFCLILSSGHVLSCFFCR